MKNPQTMKNALPKIKGNQPGIKEGKDGINISSHGESEEDDQNQPKITKIYRMNKE